LLLTLAVGCSKKDSDGSNAQSSHNATKTIASAGDDKSEKGVRDSTSMPAANDKPSTSASEKPAKATNTGTLIATDRADFRMNVGALAEEFSANLIAAEKRYIGKSVEFDASVQEIEKDDKGAYYIGTYCFDRSDVVGYYPAIVRCYFDEKETDKLATIKKFSTVKILGIVEGKVKDGKYRITPKWDFYVVVKKCRIIE